MILSSLSPSWKEGERFVEVSNRSMNGDNLNLMSISHQLSIIIKDAKISNNNIYKVTYLLLSNKLPPRP